METDIGVIYKFYVTREMYVLLMLLFIFQTFRFFRYFSNFESPTCNVRCGLGHVNRLLVKIHSECVMQFWPGQDLV